MRAFSPWSPAPTSTRPQSWWRSVLLTSSSIRRIEFRRRKFCFGSILTYEHSSKLCFDWNSQNLLAVTWRTEERKMFGLENRKKAAKLFWWWRNVLLTSSSIQRRKFRRRKFCFRSIWTCKHPASFLLNESRKNCWLWHDERRKERYLVWKIERKQPNYFDGGGTCCSLHPQSNP